MTEHTLSAQQIKALKRWPRILALTLTGGTKPTITWQEFCEAQDQFEEVLCGMRSQSSEAALSASSSSGSRS